MNILFSLLKISTFWLELNSNLLKYDAEISFCRLYDVYNDQVLKDESKNEPYLMTSEEAIKMVLEAKIFSVTAVNKLYKKSLFNQIRFEKGKIAERDKRRTC